MSEVGAPLPPTPFPGPPPSAAVWRPRWGVGSRPQSPPPPLDTVTLTAPGPPSACAWRAAVASHSVISPQRPMSPRLTYGEAAF